MLSLQITKDLVRLKQVPLETSKLIMTLQDYPILKFNNSKEWRDWLEKNHSSEKGVWINIYKKASGIETVTIEEALDQALCFGWIDELRKGYDDTSYIQKFTPRRKGSLWSKRNIEHIQRLTKSKQMMPAGIKQVELAKKDGRWDKAYDSQSNMTVPDYFLKELNKNLQAKQTFEKLSKSNKYAILWSLQTAKKEETRLRRQLNYLSKLEKGETSY